MKQDKKKFKQVPAYFTQKQLDYLDNQEESRAAVLRRLVNESMKGENND